MRFIDADSLMFIGEILFIIGFFIAMIGLLIIVCAAALGDLL